MNSKISPFLIILITSSFLYNCTNDDSEQESLLGTWKLYSVTTKTPIDTNKDGKYSNEFLSEYEKCYDMSWEFRKDGSSDLIVIGSVLTTELGEPINEPCEPLFHSCTWETNELNSMLNIKWIKLNNTDISHYKESQIEIELKNRSLVMKDYVTIIEDDKIVSCDAEFIKD